MRDEINGGSTITGLRARKDRMLTTKEKEFIERLQRRADHLAKRLAEGKARGADLSYDAAEVAAILWAVKRLAGDSQ